MDDYFKKFEDRKPPEPVPYSMGRELLWQFLVTITMILGAWYIGWRWLYSINFDALWFSIPVAMAETAAYIGLLLFSINLWKTQDPEPQSPPKLASECDPRLPNRPLIVDVFFPTYDEDPELVRLSLVDALNIQYPHPIELRIHVLDDGKREAMFQVAQELGVNYIKRDNNIGFKAGNMRNAMEKTSGDIIVICDADTRPFPTILEHTLGYFKDPDVAWVQTPQWFFDVPEGKPLPILLKKFLWWPGYVIGCCIEKIVGPIKVGQDPFATDAQMFYDVIQRRRNWAFASFCCGAGSIHRREAVMEAALKTYATAVDTEVKSFTDEVEDSDIKSDLDNAMRHELAMEKEFTPYKFHVSEDIYTSIILHSDPDRNWKSILHPQIESKMLSPQDLQSWLVQRFKYAGGTIDIAVHDSPLAEKHMSLPKKAMYASTILSNFGGLWNVIFLCAPIVYFFTGIAPVSAYSLEFFKHILPFIIMTELSFMIGTWGVAGFKGKTSYLSFFPINLRAIWTVIKGEEIKFPTTPKERQEGNFFHLIMPQFIVIGLTLLGMLYAGINYYFFNSDSSQLNGLLANVFWGLNNIIALSGIVMAAFWKPEEEIEAQDILHTSPLPEGSV